MSEVRNKVLALLPKRMQKDVPLLGDWLQAKGREAHKGTVTALDGRAVIRCGKLIAKLTKLLEEKVEREGWHLASEDPTAPGPGVPHVRGAKLLSHSSGRIFFDVVAGYITDEGDFIMTDGQSCGLGLDDFTHWAYIPDEPQLESVH